MSSPPVPPPGGPDWDQLLYMFFVGVVGVAVDWLRRRVMRHEDERERRGDAAHRRWDDGDDEEDHRHHRRTDPRGDVEEDV